MTFTIFGKEGTLKKVDVHCHADLYSEEELDAIFANPDYLVVGAAMGFESGQRLLELAERHGNLKVCLGIHPENPTSYNECEKVAIQIANNQDRIVGIGEIGLPWYNLEHVDDRQKAIINRDARELLIRFSKLAATMNLPVILHAVKSSAAVALDTLEQYNITKALFHWFKGSGDDLDWIINSGFMISVSPDCLHNQEYAGFIDRIPLNNLMLESDGPWQYEGIPGVPALIEKTAAFLGERRKIEPEAILAANYNNCLKLFGKEKLT